MERFDLLVALKEAARGGDVGVVNAFLENPQVVEKLTEQYFPGMYFGIVLKEAARVGDVGVVNAFLDNHVVLAKLNDSHLKAAFEAASGENKYKIKSVIERSYKIKEATHNLHEDIKIQNVVGVENCLAQGADVNLNIDGKTALELADESKNSAIIKLIYDKLPTLYKLDSLSESGELDIERQYQGPDPTLWKARMIEQKG